MNDEGRYSNVSRRVWGDGNFMALSAAKPNAQTLWLRLLTGPELGCVPGLFAAREGGLADALGWPLSAFRKCWKEIEERGMAQADWRAGIVWVPKSLDHNPPHSPNVVLSWKVSLKELPESKVKASAMASLALRVGAMGEPWAKAFEKASGTPCPNQEQDQEQEREHPPRARTREGKPADPLRDSLTTTEDELPVDWAPSAAHVALAQQFGLDLDDEAGIYRARRRRDGFRCGNWDADFEGWLRQGRKLARDRQKRRGGGNATHGGTSDDWPDDAALSLRERIRAGEWGSDLAKELEAGKLDSSLARRRIAEVMSGRKPTGVRHEARGGIAPVGDLLAGIGRPQ